MNAPIADSIPGCSRFSMVWMTDGLPSAGLAAPVACIGATVPDAVAVISIGCTEVLTVDGVVEDAVAVMTGCETVPVLSGCGVVLTTGTEGVGVWVAVVGTWKIERSLQTSVSTSRPFDNLAVFPPAVCQTT